MVHQKISNNKLTVLKDLGLCDYTCCAKQYDKELKEVLLEHIKAKYSPFCSCGAKLEPWYEGEVECPVSHKEWKEDEDGTNYPNRASRHHSKISNDGELAICNFIQEFIGVNDDELKELLK